jgi:hypothetical protein
MDLVTEGLEQAREKSEVQKWNSENGEMPIPHYWYFRNINQYYPSD